MVKQDISSARLRVFLDDARVLTQEEIRGLPAEKQKAASGKKGIWVEVTCPDDACSVDGSKITIPAHGVGKSETKGVWLSLFCPENQCELEQASQVP
jgi:hypothetical protein